MKRVIIAGFGPVGRALADSLDERSIDVTLIDTNAQTARAQTLLGRSVVYGDVTDPDVLAAAGLQEADAIAITIPDRDAVLDACRLARSLAPGIFIAARTGHLSQGMQATQAGADTVIIEEVVTAEAMASSLAGRLRPRGRVLCEGAD